VTVLSSLLFLCRLWWVSFESVDVVALLRLLVHAAETLGRGL
jgi:hypothetical protein